MQAIHTKYLCPTNHHGARISVRAQAGRIIVPWNYALDIEANHKRAAARFAAKLGWLDGCHLESGALPDSTFAHLVVKTR
jgi:hypothetical protein